MIRPVTPLLALFLAAASPMAAAEPPASPAVTATADAATPLRRSDVAADAVYVIHLDLQALRSGPLGLIMDGDQIEQALRDDDEDLEAWRTARPLLEKTLSLTLFGSDFEHDRTVLVVRTRAGVEEFFDALAAQDDQKPAVLEEGGRTLRVWKTGEGSVYVFADPRPGAGEVRTIVVGHSRPDFDAAIDRLDGRGGNLEGADAPLARLAHPRPGSIFFAAASDLAPLRKHEHAAAVFRNAERLRVELGEHGGSIFAETAVTASNEQTARQMADVCRGLVAMGQMFLNSQPEAAEARELLSGLEVSTQDSTTTIALTCPTAKVVSAIKAACADRPMTRKQKPESPVKGEKPAKEAAPR